MTKLVFIRHGEPDYSQCDKRGYIGHGRELAPLSANGIIQAANVSKSKLLDGAEFIVASPYTRSMQTAAIISKNTMLDIKVEMDLHEWIPDLTFQNKTKGEYVALLEDFCKNRGRYPENQHRKWETLDSFTGRLILCMRKYTKYHRIIIVTHGGVIRQFTGEESIPYCGIVEISFTNESICCGWLD